MEENYIAAALDGQSRLRPPEFSCGPALVRPSPERRTPMRKWMPLIAVCLGTFMLLVDVTIVTVALPDMAVDLKTSFSALEWVVDIYALILAALLLAMGALGDLYGRRRLYLGGLVVFALASLASGLAPNTALLIAARGLQGIRGGGVAAATHAP